MSVDSILTIVIEEEHSGLGVLVGFLDRDVRLGLHALQGSETSIERDNIEPLQLLWVEVGNPTSAIDDVLLAEVLNTFTEDGIEFLLADLGTTDRSVGKPERHVDGMLLGVGGPGSGRDFVELILTEGLGRGTDEEVLEVIEVTVRSIGLFLNLAIEDDLDVELAIPLLDFEADEVPDVFFDGIRGGDAVITAGELVEESELSVRINAEGKAYLVDLAPGEGEDPLLSVDFASGLNPAEHGFPDPIEVVFPRVSAEVILCGGFLVPLRVEAVGLIADDGVVLLEAQRSDGVSERALVLNVDGVGEGGAKGVFPAEAGIESASALDHLIGESPGETGQIAGRRVVVVLALVLVVIAHGHAESEDALLLEVTDIVIGVSEDVALGIANPSCIAIRIIGEVGLDAVDRIVELTDLILLVVDVGSDAVSVELDGG